MSTGVHPEIRRFRQYIRELGYLVERAERDWERLDDLHKTKCEPTVVDFYQHVSGFMHRATGASYGQIAED